MRMEELVVERDDEGRARLLTEDENASLRAELQSKRIDLEEHRLASSSVITSEIHLRKRETQVTELH